MAKTDLQNVLEEIKARISISDIIAQYVKLQKRGRDYIGLCPFHHEKTPSFTVNTQQGFYHCFGCGEHGDVITFEMKHNGLTFMDAVHKLADKAGVTVPTLSKESVEEQQKRKSLYEIMGMAADYYEKKLRLSVGAAGLAYFKNRRGLTDETIKKFRLGYAPNGSGLKAELLSKGIAEEDLISLGLITKNEQSARPSYDFFYERVMIPIMDKRGNVVAFGGRIMDKSEPKYLNSPETPIFNKRRILYNMNNAYEPARKAQRLIICEGYMDVIALDCFGFGYAVAPLGTALTEDQILEAWKVCPTPTLCFDGDSAGIKAAIRSVDRVLPILRAGYSVKYIFLKEKKDPDELLRTLGPDVFEKYLQNAKPLVDILWHKCKMGKETQTPEQKALLEKETYDEVAKIADVQTRNYYMQEMKKRIYYEFGKGSVYKNSSAKTGHIANKANFAPNSKNTNFVHKHPLNDLVLRLIVSAIILYPELAAKYAERLLSFDTKQSPLSKVLDEILEIAGEKEYADSENITDRLKLNYKKEIDGLWEINMLKSQNISLPDIRHQIDTGLAEIQLKQLDSEISECSALMKEQPNNSDEIYVRYKALIQERNKILLQISDGDI
ncbi:MAG: DNA primase [Alphaproteobacteria bacterium]|nr:DNA primase [Alphaproteobacteria bacterium]